MNFKVKKILYKCISILITVLLIVSTILTLIYASHNLFLMIVPIFFFALYSIFVVYFDIGNLPYYEEDGIRIYYIEETEEERLRREEVLESMHRRQIEFEKTFGETFKHFSTNNVHTYNVNVTTTSESNEVHYITHEEFNNVKECCNKAEKFKALRNKTVKKSNIKRNKTVKKANIKRNKEPKVVKVSA